MTGSDVIVQEARRWIGTPYVHQASEHGAGTDCLGLIRGVWRAVVGCEPEQVPAYTADWAEAGSEEVLWAAAMRNLRATQDIGVGQVLLFRMRNGSVAKHLGISAGDGAQPTFIHAFSGHGVIESSLTPPWARRIVSRFYFPERT